MPAVGIPINEVRVSSPMEAITENFQKQNSQLEELILRLRDKLHRLSNTNVPTESGDKGCAPETPFREGHLMDYYQTVLRNNYLISQLSVEVTKIESLI